MFLLRGDSVCSEVLLHRCITERSISSLTRSSNPRTSARCEVDLIGWWSELQFCLTSRRRCWNRSLVKLPLYWPSFLLRRLCLRSGCVWPTQKVSFFSSSSTLFLLLDNFVFYAVMNPMELKSTRRAAATTKRKKSGAASAPKHGRLKPFSPSP